MTEESPAEDPLPESLLEDGLQAFFRSGPESRRSEHSVLESIEARGAVAPRVLLRDVGSGGLTSPVRGAEIRPETGDPIQVLGEIARGGMGVVLKGRDPDLGRDLAMKVLREDLGGQPEVLQRFVEEAQIGGQLQHPGIVPVYGIGLLADERPYFTMKLVRGRTLSELLAERSSPTEGRPRFLAIFERVCQAVAYTHARGVVHRDLKPSNVMIGAFGETQIVDWGLAKVLPRGGIADERVETPPDDARVETVRHRAGSTGPDSCYGTVMGTPAYMPPEQARGLVDSLDERSDVFSLGAILCSILTGKPPYEGDPETARRRAADADLVDGRRRLAECGADRELVETCLACLAPAQSDRPRTAGVLAERMSAYLASVEERARAAQIAAAETRVRAREEKKRLVVGAVFLVVVVAGAAVGYRWIEGQRRERLAQTESAVGQALDEATRLGGRAESTGDPGSWREALQAVQAAELLLETREAPAELVERVRSSQERIEREAEASRVRTEREERNRALLARLREIRVPEECNLYSIDWSEVAEQYAAALSGAGLSFDGLSVDEAAARIRDSGIVVELSAALDEWAAAARAGGSTEAAQRLARIALEADEDPTRRDLRERMAAGDPERLAGFARGVDLEALPPTTRLLFANALGHGGSPEEAAALLREVNRDHPDDFAATVQLARWLAKRAEPPPGEIAGLYRAALALRPDSVAVRHELGKIYRQLGALESSLELFEESARRRPEDGHLRFHVGVALTDLGRHEEAITAFRASLRLDPGSADSLSNLGNSLLEVGELEEAAEHLREAVRLDPDHHEAWYNLGVARQQRGELDGVIEALREAARINPDFDRQHYNLGLALAEKGDLEGARNAFREAVRCNPGYVWALLNLGIASAGLGDLDGAADALRRCLDCDPGMSHGWHILAKILGDTGDREGALAAYRKSIELDPDQAGAHYDLGTELLEADRYEEAAEALAGAVRCAPADPRTHCNLGLALLQVPGGAQEALEALQRGHELGSRDPSWSYPSEAWIESAEVAVAMQAELREFEQSGEPPEVAKRALGLAAMARQLGQHAAAADLFALAFAGGDGTSIDPDAHRFDALRSAALGGCESPEEPEAARRRELAIGWLEVELERVEAALESVAEDEAEAARARLRGWIGDPELAGLRDPASLARLPKGEREALLALWNRVCRGLAAPE